MTNWGTWRPKEAIFEEAGVMYSREPVDGFVFYSYTLIHVSRGVRILRTIYILGLESSLDTLLDHWNRDPAVWRVERGE